jgi:diguanylate cyclase (GGDEF)-like protein/putative nucleotidyltransferase with HDIG domain
MTGTSQFPVGPADTPDEPGLGPPPLSQSGPAGTLSARPSSSHTGLDDRSCETAARAAITGRLYDASSQRAQLETVESRDLGSRLIQVRLGLASSLFVALRAKHPPTAAHSLRVALGASALACELNLTTCERDSLELAALLHDIGKIGVPDCILQKPGRLTADEAQVMAQHVGMGLEILSNCCASPEVLQIVRYAGAWFNGSRSGTHKRSGAELPIGSRIVAVVDAFDAMTTDHVYRPAWSQERALAELFHYAGTQFDPDLVRKFSDLSAGRLVPRLSQAARTWLRMLDPDASSSQWRLETASRPAGEPMTPDALFQQKLIRNMHDGVVFVDSQLRIFLWNRGAERLTGIRGAAVYRRTWVPSLLKLRNAERRFISDDQCPVARAVRAGVPMQSRVILPGRSEWGDEKELPADLHVIPVHSPDGTIQGATLLLHDVSPQTSLEELCINLHDQATKDPLTGVANRAEFDRMHELFISAHLETRLPCSLIVCDIDHFKQVNDRHGHQAGDEAIKSLAVLLSNKSQPGDVVARYGGEEFVVLCADCNNAAAAQRAEIIRRALAEKTQPMLGGNRITASFGVTELQPGDTAETMFRRADRALLQAKEMGRNLVVQLGSGMQSPERRAWWLPERYKPSVLLEKHLVTSVPMELVVEKLRGFVADHGAKVNFCVNDHIQLCLEANQMPLMPRHADRSVPFLIDLRLAESQAEIPGHPGLPPRVQTRTEVEVLFQPKRLRDRRREQATERARQILASLKSYLVAEERLPKRGRDLPASSEKPWFAWLGWTNR